MNTTTKTLETIETAKRLAFFAIDPALSAAERIAKTREIFSLLGDIGNE